MTDSSVLLTEKIETLIRLYKDKLFLFDGYRYLPVDNHLSKISNIESIYNIMLKELIVNKSVYMKAMYSDEYFRIEFDKLNNIVAIHPNAYWDKVKNCWLMPQ